jgi:hypothetical protein
MPGLVTVAQFLTALEANLFKNRLQQAGIRSVVANETSATIHPGVAGVFPFRVQVAPGDVERARAFAAETPADAARALPDADTFAAQAEAAGRCPVCASDDIAFHEERRAETTGRSPRALLDAPAVYGECRTCGHQWQLGGDDPGATFVPRSSPAVTPSPGNTPTTDLLLSFVGDDFTGSTDAMEALTRAGLRTVLFLRPPTSDDLQAFPGVRAVGVAGASRALPTEQMEAHLRPLFESLRALGTPLVHYKVCSTFDSSPTVGSIGRAIEIGQSVFDSPWVPLVVGAPC